MTEQPETSTNIYNRLGGVAAIVMILCWLSLVPLLFANATAVTNNNDGAALWTSRLVEWLIVAGVSCHILTIAFYTLGAWRGGADT